MCVGSCSLKSWIMLPALLAHFARCRGGGLRLHSGKSRFLRVVRDNGSYVYLHSPCTIRFLNFIIYYHFRYLSLFIEIFFTVGFIV